VAGFGCAGAASAELRARWMCVWWLCGVIESRELSCFFLFGFYLLLLLEAAVASDRARAMRHASRALRRACEQGAVRGSESLCGSAWFGSVWVWGGIRDSGWLGGIAADCARGIFLPRECSPGPP
jgi:hypothetical protein